MLGAQPDGLEVFAPNGRAFRFPAWSIERILLPLIVRWGIYRGVRERREACRLSGNWDRLWPTYSLALVDRAVTAVDPGRDHDQVQAARPGATERCVPGPAG